MNNKVLLVDDEKYRNSDLSLIINQLCRKVALYKVVDSRWININKKEDLPPISNKPFMEALRDQLFRGNSVSVKTRPTI